MSPILDLLASLIPPETHDLEQGDTTDDQSGAAGGGGGASTTEEEMDEEGASKHVDWREYEGKYAHQLREARDALRQAKRHMLEARGEGGRVGSGGNKRPLEGDGPRREDLAGDVDMVPTLTPGQVEDLHRGRIKEAAETYRHLQSMAAREMELDGTEERQQPRQQRRPGGAPADAAETSQPSVHSAGGQSEARVDSPRRAARRPPQRGLSSGADKPRASCVAQWQTAEERDAEVDRGRWRTSAGRARGRSSAPRREDQQVGEQHMGQQDAEAEQAGGAAAPVTPVDPLAARDLALDIAERRKSIASRMDHVRMQVDTHSAAQRIKGALETDRAIKEQERMQLLQEVEFAAVCSKRATDAGLQSEQQREDVRRLWVAEMARLGESQLAEAAFATYGPTGLPLEEQQRALRSAIRIANLGEAAERGYGGKGSSGSGTDGGPSLQQRPKSADGAGESGRSRSKSPRPRGGPRARRE